MFAMQYGFNLSDDDQLSIRSRVHEIGARFDNLPGLHQKAFLMAERLGEGRNRYTPFYLWNTLEGMCDFLLSPSFARVVAAWGRPAVPRWNPVGYVQGKAAGTNPRFAIQQHIGVPRDADLATFCESHRAALKVLTGQDGLHSAFLGIDTASWQLMQISLWDDDAATQGEGDRYEVLYLSQQR